MTFLELVQMALNEAGISQTDNLPTTLVGADGLVAHFAQWVQQAWDEIKIENDQGEFLTTWFQATLSPRFYFDTASPVSVPPLVGDVLVGQYSGATFTITNVINVNGGNWSDGTIQGQIEFINSSGLPVPSEILLEQITGVPTCRFLRWGDYRLDDANEMGNQCITDLQSIWWKTLKISDVAGANFTQQQIPLIYQDFDDFNQRLDYNQTLGTPRLVTETPDDGTRIGFYPPPDRPYRIGGYYYKTIPSFALDSDTPTGLKEFYHPMIAWRALGYYGDYEGGNQVIVALAARRYQLYKKKFDREGLQPVTFDYKRLY